MEAYLDHAATTPINDVAVDALVRVSRLIGNPSGSHRAARAAKDLLELSREQIGSYLGVDASEVIFTSGGTESDNLAIFGSLKDGKKPVASAIEHHAVLDAVTESGGKLIGATREGVVNLDELEEYLKLEGDTVCVISVMMANNETGVVQPLSEVVRLARKYSPGAACHTDAVQAPAYLDVADLASGFDLVSISAHKFGGPKGTGALVVKKSSRLRAMLRGGGQEFELRSGTPNLAGIAAMAAALEDAVANRVENVRRIAGLTELLRQGLSSKFPGIKPTGIESSQMCNITNYCFEGLNSEEILFLLDSAGIFASAGSSCASGALNPSHVLLGMGRSKAEASGSLRLSLGVSTTKEEIDYAIDVIGDVTSELAAKKGILWV
ncbi:MAG: cysteine desulfurase [Acidimicrobiaceae bacterium]|nr:cysteine desulfurase [Acidimicrobiaceae bacterium]